MSFMKLVLGYSKPFNTILKWFVLIQHDNVDFILHIPDVHLEDKNLLTFLKWYTNNLGHWMGKRLCTKLASRNNFLQTSWAKQKGNWLTWLWRDSRDINWWWFLLCNTNYRNLKFLYIRNIYVLVIEKIKFQFCFF